jgi:CII-binding regulator of phage lambda lysogenization HflD
MCKVCGNISNIHQRAANHDFMEQIQEFYGMSPKHIKNRKIKNNKKSILNKIENRISKLREKLEEFDEYKSVEQQLLNLLSEPYNENITEIKFENIMNQLYEFQMQIVLNYYRSIKT